jgi:hypothetical protein
MVLSPNEWKALRQLVATGLFGENEAEAAERLIAEKLRDLVEEGFAALASVKSA